MSLSWHLCTPIISAWLRFSNALDLSILHKCMWQRTLCHKSTRQTDRQLHAQKNTLMDSKHCTPPASWQQQNMFTPTQTCPVPLCLLRSLRRRNRSLWLSSLRRLYTETHYCSYNQNCSKMLEACQLMSDLSYQTGGWLPHGDVVRPDILEKYLGGKKKKYIFMCVCKSLLLLGINLYRVS